MERVDEVEGIKTGHARGINKLREHQAQQRNTHGGDRRATAIIARLLVPVDFAPPQPVRAAIAVAATVAIGRDGTVDDDAFNRGPGLARTHDTLRPAGPANPELL